MRILSKKKISHRDTSINVLYTYEIQDNMGTVYVSTVTQDLEVGDTVPFVWVSGNNGAQYVPKGGVV